MASRKKRKQGQKEPKGITKSEIIVYIANKGETTITDIKTHLKSEKNIGNKKNIKKHLSDLVNEGIINIKKAEKRGLSDTYYIEKTFSQFKTVFNFINDFYRPLFLKSKYAMDMINNDDFLVYGFVNIIKEFVSELQKIYDDNYINKLIEKLKRNGEYIDEYAEEFKESIENLKNNLKGYNIDNINDFNDFQDLLLTSTPEAFHIIKVLINLIFPDKQRNEMLNIISTSPMAMDYFLNLKSADRIFLFIRIIGFYLLTLVSDKNKISLLKKLPENKSKIENNPMSFISQILDNQNIKNDNPLLTILRSYFIVDSFNGNVVKNEYSNTFLKEILLPKVVK